MSKAGTIRQGEARQVVIDLIKEKGFPKAAWGFRDGKFHFLVGDRKVEVAVPAGASFYGLRSILARVDTIIEEARRAKLHGQQIDLESLIRQSEPAK